MDFDKINSATKYPSIETYHAIDPRNGKLDDGERVQFEGEVIATEKVDGANGRIIFMPDGDWFIGSREELLYARGDRIGNPALSIVSVLKPVAVRLKHRNRADIITTPGIDVFFMEVYGQKVSSGSKNYTKSGLIHYRMFDVAWVPMIVLKMPRESISSWREHGGQTWMDESHLQWESGSNEIDLVPRLGTIKAADLPESLEGMLALLHSVTGGVTRVALDDTANGVPEGVVLRTPDRSVIAKARFQDYNRTLYGSKGGR